MWRIYDLSFRCFWNVWINHSIIYNLKRKILRTLYLSLTFSFIRIVHYEVASDFFSCLNTLKGEVVYFCSVMAISEKRTNLFQMFRIICHLEIINIYLWEPSFGYKFNDVMVTCAYIWNLLVSCIGETQWAQSFVRWLFICFGVNHVYLRLVLRFL